MLPGGFLWREIMVKREEMAAANFLSGTNCAQAVLMAYADVLGLTREQAAMVSNRS